MAKTRDITDKLTFDGNPSLVINGKRLEVNSDAPTVLKVMGLMSDGDPGAKDMMDAFSVMFPEKSRKEIEKMKLNFQDLMVVVSEAVALIIGEETEPGEQ